MTRAVAVLFGLMTLVVAAAQNGRIDGYKGIWFTLGQVTKWGDKYSGGLGTYTSSHVPVAIYAKAAGKTFFVYGGTTAATERHLLIMASYYDHKTGLVPKPVIVYDKKGVDDPHDNASLSLDEGGYVWVFVSGRNTIRPGIIFKSLSPYSIDSFCKLREGEMTYPQPWWVAGKGFLHLFTKYTKGRELYWNTSANGTNWSEDHKLAGMGGHYGVSCQWKNKVFLAFNYHPNGDVNKRTNLYLLQTTDGGQSWTTVDGKPVATPLIAVHNEALVKDYEAEKKMVYLSDLTVDENGNPVILAVISKGAEPGPENGPREWTVSHWKNGAWTFSNVCNSTHNYDMGSLYIEGNKWTIIGPTEAGPQQWGTGGEMAMWRSIDGGKTWAKKRLLTGGSMYNHSYARRPLNAHPQFYAVWADGDADKLSPSCLYFCNKSGDVWKLPYTMEKEFEKPSRYKPGLNQ